MQAYTEMNTQNLNPPWQTGTSGNPNGRPKGTPTLRGMMKRRDAKAWETFDKLLTEGEPEMQARMFLLFLCFRFQPTPAMQRAAKRLVEAEIAPAELEAMQEQAKLLQANEEP